MIGSLKNNFHRLIQTTELSNYRYLFDKFYIKQRLTGIVGARGTGKTTLMLQYIKKNLYENGNVFYFSADHIYFNEVSLYSFIEEAFLEQNIRIFFIDEIHKYTNWDQELKNIYDNFPEVFIIFSGSSSIDLVRGSYDLSRRATLYHLKGLSFREYLNFTQNKSYSVISLQDLLENPVKINKILGELPKVKTDFQQYLTKGFYPFVLEGEETLYKKLLRIIEKAIYEDIASFYNLKTPNLHYFKKILTFLASIPPGNINTHNLANNLQIDHKTAFHYLEILNEIQLVKMVYPSESGNQRLRKPEKIFLDNTTLYSAVNSQINQPIDKGVLRELFFLQMIAQTEHKVFYSKIGDYLIDNYTFEIGGKNKTKKQLKTISGQAYLVKDDLVYAHGQEIPLYYFGFIY